MPSMSTIECNHRVSETFLAFKSQIYSFIMRRRYRVHNMSFVLCSMFCTCECHNGLFNTTLYDHFPMP